MRLLQWLRANNILQIPVGWGGIHLEQRYFKELLYDKRKQTYSISWNNGELPQATSPKRKINDIFYGSKVSGIMYTTAKKYVKVSITHKKWISKAFAGEYFLRRSWLGRTTIFPPWRNKLCVLGDSIKCVLIDPSSFVSIIHSRSYRRYD